MLCTNDIFVLITYCSFVESFFIMLSVSGVLWLRYSRPKMERPIKVKYYLINFNLIESNDMNNLLFFV